MALLVCGKKSMCAQLNVQLKLFHQPWGNSSSSQEVSIISRTFLKLLLLKIKQFYNNQNNFVYMTGNSRNTRECQKSTNFWKLKPCLECPQFCVWNAFNSHWRKTRKGSSGYALIHYSLNTSPVFNLPNQFWLMLAWQTFFFFQMGLDIISVRISFMAIFTTQRWKSMFEQQEFKTEKKIKSVLHNGLLNPAPSVQCQRKGDSSPQDF